MNNLLELGENKEAVSISASCNYIGSRKELYIKALVLFALKNTVNFIKTEESLFYNHKFYSFSGIFDFYINNNAFDLIVLKPESNELLFEIDNEDIHSNLHGYIVARLNPDIKQTEILGYFLNKDFDKIIKDNTIDTTALKDVELLKDLDTLEAQMSLEDVSDRFFELLSEFLDENIDEQNSSELACLLYNSAELRHAFFEVTQFDKLCADIATNQDCFPEDFFNEITETQEETDFSLDDLALSDEDTQLSQTDLADIAEEINQENTQMEEFELQDDFDINELETPEIIEENGEFDTLDNLNSLPEENENELKLDFEEVAPDTITEKTKNTDELDSFELDLEELDEKDSEQEGSPVNLSLAEKLAQLKTTEHATEPPEDISLQPQNEQESVSPDNTDEPELELSLVALDELVSEETKETDGTEEIEERETSSTLPNDMPEHALTSEEPTVAEIKQKDTQTLDIAALEDLESLEKTPTNEQSNNDEIMNLLENSSDENVIVDETELLSILGIESAPSTEHATADELPESDSTNEIEPQVEPQVESQIESQVEPHVELQNDDLSQQQALSSYEMDEISEIEPSEENEDLNYLYTEENIPANDTFPGDSIVNSTSNQLSSARPNKKKVIVVAAVLAMLFALGGGATLMLNKTSSTNNDIASDLPLDTDAPPEDNLTIPPPQNDTDIDATTSVPADTSADANETRIVSSLTSQATAAPVILKDVKWQVPTSISNDAVFGKYLQIAGKIIKTNLASDLLNSNDFAYNDKIKVSMTVKNNAPVKNIKVIESSGSKEVDEIVLQSIKETLKYINTPVMSVDTSNKDVVLVISI